MQKLFFFLQCFFHLLVLVVGHRSGCYDSDRNCASWARKGECRRNAKWMLVNCKKSCNQCSQVRRPLTTHSQSRGCYDYNQNCQSWARNGECQRNAKWMLVNCKKSCNQCSKGSCRDLNENCARHRNRCNNQDANWRRWIRQNCPKTCGLCGSSKTPPPKPGPEPTSYCSDTKGWGKVCASYKLYNWCRVSGYYTATKAHCRKTCGFCTPIVKPVTPRPRPRPTVKTTPKTPKTNPKPGRSCGRDKLAIMSRVVGGTDAYPHRWEWQGGMYYKNFLNQMEFQCGASLISKNVLLTAAHCVHKRRDPKKMMIILGDDKRDKKEVGEQSLKVKKIVIHERYNTRNNHNDIALLQLDRDAEITETVGTVCMADRDIDPRNNPLCYISGWGKTHIQDPAAYKLQEAELPILTNRECKKRNNRVISTMLCGGFTKVDGKVSGCMGDSGGPYVCKSDGKWVLHGVMSWGSGKCEAQHLHTVFTRVSKYRGWINDKMRSM